MMKARAKTLRETAVLGTILLLLVTTYSSFSQIVTYITEHQDNVYPFQGQLVLIINFVFYFLGLTRAPSLRNFKRQFQIASLCYALNYALYLLQFNRVLGLLASMLGAAVGGFGASVLWASQGGYMMRLFRMNQIEKNEEGYYMGIQNGLVFTSVLLGSVIITFGLGLFGNVIYYLLLTTIALLAFLICTFFLDSLQEGEQLEKRQSWTCKSLLNNIKQVIKFVPNMKYLYAAMFLDGLMLGFVASYFSHLIPEPIRSSLNVGIVLMINGVGAMIGGYFSGYLSDKISPGQLGVLGFLFITFTLLLTLLSHYITLSSLAYPSLMGFLWGVSLYFLQGWIFVCCAKVMKGQMRSFAIVKQVHTISFIIFQIYMIIVDNQINDVAYLITLILLAMISIVCSKKMESIRQAENHKEIVEEASPTSE